MHRSIIFLQRWLDYEVALIKVIENEKEATDLLIRCRSDKFVYHTEKEELYMEIVNIPILRGRMK